MLKPENIKTAKVVAKFVATRTVSGVVVTLIHQNTAVETKNQKVQLYVGAYLIGSMVADRAQQHVETLFDDATKAYNEFQENRKKTQTAEK